MSNNHFSIRQHLPTWILVGAGVTAMTGFAVQLHALEELIDRPLAQFMRLQSDSAVGLMASFLTDFGKAYWFLIPALVLFVAFRFFWRKPLWASRALFVFTSVAASGLVADVLKLIFGRARPKLLLRDDVYQFFFFRFGADYNSFPSGHAVCALAAGLALAIILPRYRMLSIVAGLLLASTRVITTAHYLSDVIASATIAIITVLAVRAAFTHYGLSWNNGASAMVDRRRSTFALAMLGGAPSTDVETTEISRPADGNKSIVEIVMVSILIASVGLALSLGAVEWYAPTRYPVPDWWLWLTLSLCLGFGTALRLTSRSSIGSRMSTSGPS